MEGLVLRIDAKLCHVEVDGKTLTLPLRGRLFETPSHQVRPVAVGDRVVTSGHGGAFPPGIPVGVVAEVGELVMRVRPIVDLRRIEFTRLLDYVQLQTPEGEATPAAARGRR